jgi:hypothetical protein
MVLKDSMFAFLLYLQKGNFYSSYPGRVPVFRACGCHWSVLVTSSFSPGSGQHYPLRPTYIQAAVLPTWFTRTLKMEAVFPAKTCSPCIKLSSVIILKTITWVITTVNDIYLYLNSIQVLQDVSSRGTVKIVTVIQGLWTARPWGWWQYAPLLSW